jgi:hypothetical protein
MSKVGLYLDSWLASPPCICACSPLARDLIAKLLVKTPSVRQAAGGVFCLAQRQHRIVCSVVPAQLRLTFDEVLKHPWMTGDAHPDLPLSITVLDSLRSFEAEKKFKRIAIFFYGEVLSEEERQTFKVRTGAVALLLRCWPSGAALRAGLNCLSRCALKRLLCSLRMPRGLFLQKTFDAIDQDHNGTITYEGAVRKRVPRLISSLLLLSVRRVQGRAGQVSVVNCVCRHSAAGGAANAAPHRLRAQGNSP